jgi:DNA-binding MarR family transcriptional regulator
MEHYTAESFSLEKSVGFKLTKARNRIVAEIDRALVELNITSTQVGIVLAMAQGSASTPVELVKILSIDAGLMTRMLDKLEAKELLKRSRSTEDRRVVNLMLTERGQDTAAEIPRIATQVLNSQLKSFTTAEFEELGRLLQKFIGD